MGPDTGPNSSLPLIECAEIYTKALSRLQIYYSLPRLEMAVKSEVG